MLSSMSVYFGGHKGDRTLQFLRDRQARSPARSVTIYSLGFWRSKWDSNPHYPTWEAGVLAIRRLLHDLAESSSPDLQATKWLEFASNESPLPVDLLSEVIFWSYFGRNNWIRTSGLIVPNDALYQAELYSVIGGNSGRPSHRFAEFLRLTLGHCLYSRRIISYFHSIEDHLSVAYHP